MDLMVADVETGDELALVIEWASYPRVVASDNSLSMTDDRIEGVDSKPNETLFPLDNSTSTSSCNSLLSSCFKK